IYKKEMSNKHDFGLTFDLKPSQQEFPVFQCPEANESFLEQPSKLEEVFECLTLIENANKMDSAKADKKPTVQHKSLEDLDFLVTLRKPSSNEATFRRAKANQIPMNTNQFTFMRQIEPEPEDRILARNQREIVANTFRRMGNYEYRKRKFDEAIGYYTKGLQYVQDTPVLYVNRAMCYIKLREYKRGIMDCNYVLTHIDEKYVRAWLYRAAAYKRLDDEANYEDSVYQARRLNYTETAFINEFLDKIRTLL
ncbi:hypothetical protein KR054_008042, partial [Drosophila jambulina]